MFRLIPVGGIGEIGLNMIVFDSGKSSIAIDSGVLFPPFQYLGIETIIPDYDEVFRTFPNLKALFITHGHEDHIGGIPYMLDRFAPKIFATAYASEVIKFKCRNIIGNKYEADITPVKYGKKIQQDDFNIEYIQVDHSIPDSSALFIKVNGVNVLYVADFRLMGENRDTFIAKINEIKKDNRIDLMLSDSTNAHEDEEPVSEKDVFAGLDSYFLQAKKKIIVTLFSSNIARINQVISLCKKHGKSLFISGTNLKAHIAIAKNLGYIEPDDGCIKNDREMNNTSPQEMVMLCTGSQAERNSSIVKLSYGIHAQAKIEEDDMVIFSSSQIPGNEKTIMGAINRLAEKGAKIVYTDVHSSGHASEPELRELIKIVRPENFVPIHGEFLQLSRHLEIAKEEGVRKENCFLLKDGDELSYDKNGISVKSVYEFNRYYIDSTTRDIIEKEIVKERTICAERGLIVVSLAVDKKDKLISKPVLTSFAVSKSHRTQSVLDKIENQLMNHLRKNKVSVSKEINEIKNLVKREFRRVYDNKPEVLVTMVKVNQKS
ncbi:MAG: ribonuclease J [Pseudomonadota bacterium]